MFKIPKNQEYIISKLQKKGFEAFIVGGCVRDMALGIKPSDYDVTTNAKPQDIINIFEKTIPTGIKHGTVTVVIDGEVTFVGAPSEEELISVLESKL